MASARDAVGQDNPRPEPSRRITGAARYPALKNSTDSGGRVSTIEFGNP